MELVGTEVKKTFVGFGTFTGKILSYDASAGYFKIQYEDGDSEEVDHDEIASILDSMGLPSPLDPDPPRRTGRGRPPNKRRRLDPDRTDAAADSGGGGPEIGPAKGENSETLPNENVYSRVLEEAQVKMEELESENCKVASERRKRKRLSVKEKTTPELPPRRSGRKVKGEDVSVSEDADLGGNGYFSAHEELVMPALPPSSTDLDLDGLNVFDFFSVYTCLRSFSRLLFLSPFTLEAFVAALRCKYTNLLIDSIHYSILQVLKLHLEFHSGEGSETAVNCLRSLNWGILDLVTWPLFLAEYLLIHASRMKLSFKISQFNLLDTEYYENPAGVKLEILRCLCDDVIEVETIRLEINRRMADYEANVDANRNMNVQKKRKPSANVDSFGSLAHEVLEETDDGNSDECCLCGMEGSLICCDGCPAAFHSRCVGVVKDLLPEGDWYCPECVVEKSDKSVKLSKPFRGADILGIDPHGRVYFGTCDRLLVSGSCDSDASYHYYNKNDLSYVINILKSSYASYSAIINAISMYWGIHSVGQYGNNNHMLTSGSCDSDASYHYYNKNDLSYVINILKSSYASYSAIINAISMYWGIHSVGQYGNNNHIPRDDLDAQVPPSPSKQDIDGKIEKEAIGNSASPKQFGAKRSNISNSALLNSMTSFQFGGLNCPFACSEPFDEMVHAAACLPVSQLTDIANINSDAPSERISSLKQAVGLGSLTELTGLSCTSPLSDSSSYQNYYSLGRIASSIAKELLHKISVNNNNELEKLSQDIRSAQLKAISKKSNNCCWYTYDKLSADVQKENCGWCICCKTSSDNDCLFKVAYDKCLVGLIDEALAGGKSRMLGLHSANNKKNHVDFAIHHILLIEDRVRGLLSGPWENPYYSDNWQEAVSKASDAASLKPLLLSLESSLRRIALSVDWSKPLDYSCAIGSGSTILMSTPARTSSNSVASRKPAKKLFSGDDFSLISHATTKSSNIYWWRGGKFSCQVFQWNMLPRSLASKGARQGGCRKIPNIIYSDSSEFAKRSKCVAWQAAVEMSQSVTQIIYQVQELAANIKWMELFETRLFSQSTSKKVSRSLKKVTIRRKRIEGTLVKYLLDFGKRETVPAIVTRHGVLLEEHSSGRKSYWLNETLVPLNLLKSFEERKLTISLKKSDLGTHSENGSKCEIKKKNRPKGFSYLMSRVQKFDTEVCGHCNKDVLVRMATQENQGMGSSSSSNFNRKDPGWKYNILADPNDSNSVTCLFCNKITKGGIYRAKQHQIGKYRNAKACDKCPPDVKEELENHITQKKTQRSQTFEPIYHLGDYGVDEEIEVQELHGGGRDKRGRGGGEAGSSKKMKTKATNLKGPMDLYTSRTQSTRNGEKARQISMNEACDKELRGRTIQHIARFFYQAGIAFNVAHLENFKTMINAIGNYGPNLKPPSYHELRVPLLKKELDYTKDLMKGHKEDWEKYSSSIMSDAWTDRKHRTLINFLVNGTKGTMFMESIDGSSFVKTGEKMFELLDKFVQRIGEKNVVQVISDNGSNYVLAGKLLEAKRKHLFWTPCAAHCIDLMLEDIGKIDKIKRTIGRAINLVEFIYNHTFVLNMMREFTNKKELVRCGVTRFATSFLTLQSVYKQKSCLRNMFTSEKWMESRWAKEAKGKKAS